MCYYKLSAVNIKGFYPLIALLFSPQNVFLYHAELAPSFPTSLVSFFTKFHLRVSNGMFSQTIPKTIKFFHFAMLHFYVLQNITSTI